MSPDPSWVEHNFDRSNWPLGAHLSVPSRACHWQLSDFPRSCLDGRPVKTRSSRLLYGKVVVVVVAAAAQSAIPYATCLQKEKKEKKSMGNHWKVQIWLGLIRFVKCNSCHYIMRFLTVWFQEGVRCSVPVSSFDKREQKCLAVMRMEQHIHYSIHAIPCLNGDWRPEQKPHDFLWICHVPWVLYAVYNINVGQGWVEQG